MIGINPTDDAPVDRPVVSDESGMTEARRISGSGLRISWIKRGVVGWVDRGKKEGEKEGEK